MIINYEKENERSVKVSYPGIPYEARSNLMEKLEYRMEQVRNLKKSISEYTKIIQDNASLKEQVCDFFNLNSGNVKVLREITQVRTKDGYYPHFFTNFFTVQEEDSNIVTCFGYRFKNGKIVDLLPLLFKNKKIFYVDVRTESDCYVIHFYLAPYPKAESIVRVDENEKTGQLILENEQLQLRDAHLVDT